MSFINWSPDMSVSNAQMDKQHQRLIDIINRYHDALDAGEPHAQLMMVFKEVISYAVEHFRDEEREMEQHQYPNLQRHRLIHQNLTQRISEFVTAMEKHQPGVEREIQFFLKSWLTAHIMGIDKQYVPYMSKAVTA